MSLKDRSTSEVAVALPEFGSGEAASPERSLEERPVAGWLVTRADQRSNFTGPWRQWVAEIAGLPDSALDSCREGPCAAVAWLDDPAACTWARVRPVHLIAAMDHLRLAPRDVLGLSEEEAASLLASVNAHVAGSSLRFHAVSADEWLLESSRVIDCRSASPEEAIDSNLRDFQPRGADAGDIRRLQTELQMLLHEHPVNEARAGRGQPAANSLWLWGFGSLPSVADRPLPDLYTDDPWLRGLWQLHGNRTPGPGEFDHRALLSGGLRIAAATHGWRTVTAAGGAPEGAPADELFRFLRDALRAGELQRLRLLVGSTEFEITPRARWRFWRRMTAMGDSA